MFIRIWFNAPAFRYRDLRDLAKMPDPIYVDQPIPAPITMEPYELIDDDAQYIQRRFYRDPTVDILGCMNLDADGSTKASYDRTGLPAKAYARVICISKELMLLNRFLSLPKRHYSFTHELRSFYWV